jgi:hypothetical protein
MGSTSIHMNAMLPEDGYLRVAQIVGRRGVSEEEAAQNRRDAEEAIKAGRKPNSKPKRPRAPIPPLIPICESLWWMGCATGRFPPAEYPFGKGLPLWHVSRIRKLLQPPAVDDVRAPERQPAEVHR